MYPYYIHQARQGLAQLNIEANTSDKTALSSSFTAILAATASKNSFFTLHRRFEPTADIAQCLTIHVFIRLCGSCPRYIRLRAEYALVLTIRLDPCRHARPVRQYSRARQQTPPEHKPRGASFLYGHRRIRNHGIGEAACTPDNRHGPIPKTVELVQTAWFVSRGH